MNIRPLCTTFAICLGLSGCVTYDSYTSERQVSTATTGAATGAGIGAVSAAFINRVDISRGRNQRVLAAAPTGGAIGDDTGYYIGRQEAKLRQSLLSTGVSVVRNGDQLVLVMPYNMTYASGSSSLMPDFEQLLNSFAKDHDKTLLEITGHTGSQGTDSAKLSLSKSRSRSVSNSPQRKIGALNWC